MSGNVGIEVLGLKEALKELNRIDPKLRREITRDFKQIVKPVITRAEALLPSGAPLSGMARSWKGKSGADIMSWMDTRVKKNLKPFTSGKQVRDSFAGYRQNLGVFGVRWAGPQATIFDMAAEGQLSENLTAKYGQPSRVIYRAYNAAYQDVNRQVTELVNKVMKQTNNAMRI
jgi:hypothetical protein